MSNQKTLHTVAQKNLVQQILSLPPQLKEQIIKEATHMDRIEIEERVYDKVYEELRCRLAGMVMDVLRVKVDRNSVKESDFFGEPYHFELADEITTEIMDEYSHCFIRPQSPWQMAQRGDYGYSSSQD
jgi:hypothetical protein